ncbi:Predicted ATP-binding protein involved in virulence [Litoreibacter ascidiaceicola]|uniref:Predicted ATP-binding protein involved in virulence n=1 Tax=Litoreibacter ascidiaceicola TaxID=1486859 RepID=A0A1M5CQH7_9RHOB|nr:Predicted ATP-binding protein involved in virulence [Litoreibacter ascidiaceicola]
MTKTSLRITKLTLSDIGPFPALNLSFRNDAGINLICGDNGIGKTTVLEAITASFSLGRTHRLKRRQSAESGSSALTIQSDGSEHIIQIQVNELDPKQGEFLNYSRSDAKNLIHIRASRDLTYFQQNTISRDPTFDEKNFRQKVANDLSQNEIKTWLTNRYLLAPHANKSSWTPQMLENLETAKRFFSILDPEVVLDQVDVTSFEVLVSTPNGIIPFELLSSGFRSSYFLLLSILKELEFRNLKVSASEFSGVILIDEIDLHLHPSWQQEIGRILSSAFPHAQIIVTTHSPHVVQTTNSNEVISLRRNEDGSVERKSISTGKYGFKGWTIEEILEDVMGVENTRTPTFRDAMHNFDTALDMDDSKGVNQALAVLKEMLHEQSPLRKLLEIQSAPFAFDSSLDEATRD